MAFDAYMWLENPVATPPVKGETKDATYSANFAFEIYSFSWGASNPTTISSGTIGSGGGKVSISGFNVMKATDTSSPDLFTACCSGGHFGDATVVLRKAGGTAGATGTVYITYKFKEVFVESIQWSGSSGGDDKPTESVSFSFGACQLEYTPQNADGTAGTLKPACWSLTQNKAVLAS